MTLGGRLKEDGRTGTSSAIVLDTLETKISTGGTSIADELELFRAQLGTRLSSHGITLPYVGPAVDFSQHTGAKNGSRIGTSLGALNTGSTTGTPVRRRGPVLPSAVDIGPLDLARVGLACTSSQYLHLPTVAKRSFEQLNILPIIDFGGLDSSTMGVRCGPRELRSTPGLAIKRKSKVPFPRDGPVKGQVGSQIVHF